LMNTTQSMYTLLPPQHWLFQVANFCLFMSYIMFNILYLRILLATASFFFVLWCILVLQVSLDGTLWNFVFLIINIGHVTKMLYDKRPLKFDEDKEFIWEHVFYENIRLDRHTYARLTSTCEISNFEKDEYYAHDGDLVTRLSVLIQGNMEVIISKDNKYDNTMILRPLDFVDSPEWAQSVSRFTVDIKCTAPSKVLSWSSLTIRKLKNNDPSLWGILTGLLAKDITKKLIDFQTKLMESDAQGVGALYGIFEKKAAVKKEKEEEDEEEEDVTVELADSDRKKM